jgi:hypothetical protein
MERGRRRSGSRLKTEMLSCDDPQNGKGGGEGLRENWGGKNVKLLSEYTTQENTGRQI